MDGGSNSLAVSAGGDSNLLIKGLHRAVDGLFGLDLSADLSDKAINCKLKEWLELNEQCMDMLVGCAGHNHVLSEAREKADDSAETRALMQVLRVREHDLRTAMANLALKKQPSFLQDFDWQLQYVMATDKLATLESLRLDLQLNIDNGDTCQSTALEMDEDQLNSFVTMLEAVNEEVMNTQL